MIDYLLQFVSLIGGTFVSEDLTCVSAGVMLREGQLTPALAIGGCFVGIVIGDIGLWCIGRLASHTWLGRGIGRQISKETSENIRQLLDSHGGRAVAIVRFMPGVRLPLYLAAGGGGMRLSTFTAWAAASALVWTPLVILVAVLFGSAVLPPLRILGLSSWFAVPVVVAASYLVLRKAVPNSQIQRARWLARISKIWRWEFWPSWLFYLPLVPTLCRLAIQYRSLTVWTAANPGIPQGGIIGESKFDILSQLPSDAIVPTGLISPGPVVDRVAWLRQWVERRQWNYPLILKPDVGQRGSGVSLVASLDEAAKYFESSHGSIIVQPYHPGPFEAGVFYYRFPGKSSGHIFSITDKIFPVLQGDGRHTVEELIWLHPRYRMQAVRFLEQNSQLRNRVPAEGETLPLTIAGNHSQGTLFRDGEHLRTPELERAVDRIARQFPGFCFGRFDMRYSSVTDFRAGRGLAIVELNGVTSESTNLYDPTRSLVSAYQILMRQWELLFAIGNANRQAGIQPSTMSELCRLLAGSR